MMQPKRVAVLHTGEKMEFPAHTPDHVVHSVVRKKMGLPPPEPPNSEVVNSAITAMHALVRQIAAIASTVNQAAQNVQEAAQSVAGVEQGLHHLSEAVGHLHNTVSKPKRAVRNKDGSWSTETVEN